MYGQPGHVHCTAHICSPAVCLRCPMAQVPDVLNNAKFISLSFLHALIYSTNRTFLTHIHVSPLTFLVLRAKLFATEFPEQILQFQKRDKLDFNIFSPP